MLNVTMIPGPTKLSPFPNILALVSPLAHLAMAAL